MAYHREPEGRDLVCLVLMPRFAVLPIGSSLPFQKEIAEALLDIDHFQIVCQHNSSDLHRRSFQIAA